MEMSARTANIRQTARARLLPLVQKLRITGTLQAILLLGLVVIVLCVIVTPPWWHYDEPGHFEYVWLAAHSPTWPVKGQSDPVMRKELGKSLLEYGWYRVRNMEPDLSGTKPIPIGITQVGDQPGYYFVASLPLRLVPNAPILVQYYLARLMSLILYLLIVIVAWYALGEFLPEDHPLRWMITLFIALLPAFVDTMVSVNNDVSAVLAASLFLWASLRLIQRGYSIGRVLFLAASLAACYLSKSTAYFAFGLVPFVLILALLRGRFAAWVWGATAVALIAAAVLTLKWGSPLAWYHGPAGVFTPRVQVKDAPVGNYAFQFDDSGTGKATSLLQIIPPQMVKPLRGKTLTVGAWMWSSQPTTGMTPFVQFMTDSGKVVVSPHQTPKISQTPRFRALTFTVPEDATRAVVYIRHSRHGIAHNRVFYDGLVLAVGEFGTVQPSFSDASGARGTWNGHEFTNLLRNASAEVGSVQLRGGGIVSRVASFLMRTHINPYFALATLQDWRGSSWYYTSVASVLFRSFWASMAGDKAFLRSTAVSSFLLAVTIAGMAGVPVWLWKRRRGLRWDLIGFLGVALLLPWFLAASRGTASFLEKIILYPWARYAYPAILPTATLLCTGWLAWLELLSAPLKLDENARKAIFLGGMMGLLAFALMNAIEILHRQWWDGAVSLLLLLLFQYAIFRWLVGRRKPAGITPPPDSAGAA